MKLTKDMAGRIVVQGNKRLLARWSTRAFYHVVEPRPWGVGGGVVALCGRGGDGMAWADFQGGPAEICGRCWELVQQLTFDSLGGGHG